MVDKVALGQVFSEYFGFPCQSSTKFSILTAIRGRYNRPEVADVPSGPSLDSTPHCANLNIFLNIERSSIIRSALFGLLPSRT
jgi:hypothetical protein